MRKLFTPIFVLFFVVTCKQNATAQVDTFATLLGSPVNTTGWNMVGKTKLQNIVFSDNSEILLCPNNAQFTSGALFYNDSLNLGKCSRWVADFDFRMFDGSSADGFTFCFLDKPPTGYVYGQGLGIPQNANGLKVCFDTWNNCNCDGTYKAPKLELRWGKGYDTVVASGSGITCYDSTHPGNGECNAAAYPTIYSLSLLRSNTYNHATVKYNAGQVDIYINGTLYISKAIPPITYAGYLGFTASVGFFNDNHSIRNVVIRSDIANANAGLPKVICSKHVDTIGVANTPGYIYSWKPNYGLSDTTISNPLVNIINNGVSPITQKYYVYTAYDNATQCTTVDSVIVTINPLPHLDSIVGNKNVCINHSNQFSNTTTGGDWISLNPTVASINNSGLVTGISLDTTTIRYIVTNSYNCKDSVSAKLTIRPIPLIDTIKGNMVVCALHTTQLSNDTTGGSWQSMGNSIATVNSSTGLVTGVNAGNVDIKYYVTSIYGCVDSVSKNLIVNPLPIIPAIGGAENICFGKTTQVTNAVSGGTWTSTNISVATIDNNGNITTVAAGTTIIRYIVTNSFGCSDSVSLNFTVNSLPVITAISGSDKVCTGSNISLSSAPLGGSWISSNTVAATVTNSGSVSGLTAGSTIIKYIVTNGNGCTDSVSYNVQVNATSASTTNHTACDSYSWNSTTYTTSGTYVYHTTNSLGCDSAATLILIINNTTHNSTNQTACDNYTWNGNNYTTSGTYTYSYNNVNGCPSVDTLHLTINNATHNSTNQTACDTYSWNGNIYTTSGTYTYSYNNVNGCPSVDTLHLTINNATHNSSNQTACDSYIWNGNTYTISATYTYSYNNTNGCPSVDTLHLTINNATHNSSNQISCDSYTWNGNNYTTSGTYTYSYNNANGCPSVDTLYLTINNATHNSSNQTACDSYTWNGNIYTTSGTYTYSYNNANGCPSVDTLHLTINNATHNSINQTACDSYTWNGNTYTTSGTYTYSYNNANGCPSVDTLHLTINNATHNSSNQTACDTYTWNGNTYTTSGTYTYSYNNANGCPSVDTLHLTINNATHNSSNQTACDSYTWNGNNYTTSGTYTYSYNNTNGCPSVDTLHLTINNATHNSSNQTACDSYTWNGNTYTTSGTYTYSYNNTNGCPSVDTLHLTINNATHNSSNQTSCDSYTWNGNNYTTSGTYTYSYNNTNGCPSVDTLHLTINKPSSSITASTICDSIQWNGTTYSTSGTYTFKTTNASGCDSLATLVLTVQKFKFTINANPNPIASGANLVVTLNSTNTIATSIWQPVSLFVNNFNIQNVNAPDSSFTIKVTATSSDNCTDTASVRVNVNNSNGIYIPNVFDVSNNTDPNIYTFKVYGSSIASTEAQIYNQWGERIFTGNNIHIKGWDGKYLGKTQPIGAYVYVISFKFYDGKTLTKKGIVNLIR